jgi:hypothetical protein
LNTADKDHRKCVAPTCESYYFYWSDIGTCEKCPEYKVQKKTNKGECELFPCPANRKIEKDGKKLKCTACPRGRIAGGDNKEKCIVEFDETKFKAADTVEKDDKLTKLDD